jgi:hypothetical protein
MNHRQCRARLPCPVCYPFELARQALFDGDIAGKVCTGGTTPVGNAAPTTDELFRTRYQTVKPSSGTQHGG